MNRWTSPSPRWTSQGDPNYGLAGGILLAVVQEPFSTPGRFELFKSVGLPTPDGIARSTPHEPRRMSDQCSPAYDGLDRIKA